jgi:hypothetical protein
MSGATVYVTVTWPPAGSSTVTGREFTSDVPCRAMLLTTPPDM